MYLWLLMPALQLLEVYYEVFGENWPCHSGMSDWYVFICFVLYVCQPNPSVAVTSPWPCLILSTIKGKCMVLLALWPIDFHSCLVLYSKGTVLNYCERLDQSFHNSISVQNIRLSTYRKDIYVEFQKVTQRKYPAHTLKDKIWHKVWILRAVMYKKGN